MRGERRCLGRVEVQQRHLKAGLGQTRTQSRSRNKRRQCTSPTTRSLANPSDFFLSRQCAGWGKRFEALDACPTQSRLTALVCFQTQAAISLLSLEPSGRVAPIRSPITSYSYSHALRMILRDLRHSLLCRGIR